MPKEVAKKECPICHKIKALSSGYYKSSSPLFSNDGCVPICTSCVKKEVVNDDGTINLKKFRVMLQRLDKPLYWNYLESAIKQVSKEHGYISNDEVAKYGDKIVSIYFKNVMLRQTKDKSFSDSEKDGFISQNSNILKSEYDRINRKYNSVNGASTEQSHVNGINVSSDTNAKQIIWTDQDNQNKNYAIEVVGYDPFDEYPEEGRKFLYNQLSPYLEDDSNVDDAYKLSQILQIIKNNYQIDTCDKKMSQLDPLRDADSIKTLSGIKNQLVQSNDKIAKENEISVKNRSDKAAGKSTLTYLMRDLREKDFEKAEADYYDQLKSAGTRWAVDMSITSIKQNGMFDENDKKEIYEMQLDLIDSLNQQVDDLKEKVRLLQIDNDRLKAGIADGI